MTTRSVLLFTVYVHFCMIIAQETLDMNWVSMPGETCTCKRTPWIQTKEYEELKVIIKDLHSLQGWCVAQSDETHMLKMENKKLVSRVDKLETDIEAIDKDLQYVAYQYQRSTHKVHLSSDTKSEIKSERGYDPDVTTEHAQEPSTLPINQSLKEDIVKINRDEIKQLRRKIVILEEKLSSLTLVNDKQNDMIAELNTGLYEQKIMTDKVHMTCRRIENPQANISENYSEYHSISSLKSNINGVYKIILHLAMKLQKLEANDTKMKRKIKRLKARMNNGEL